MPTIEQIRQQAEQTYARGDALAAEALCRQVLQATPNDATVHHLLGLIYVRLNRNEIAEQHIAHAMSLGRRTGDVYAHLGLAQAGMGRFREARDNFLTGIRLQPTCFEGHLGLASALTELGDVAAAERSARMALQINSASIDCWNILGNAVRLQGRLREATDCYAKGVELGPTNIAALNNLANMMQMSHRMDLAMDLYRRILRVEPNNVQANSNLAVLLKELSQFEEAENCLRIALAADPKMVDAWVNLGGILQGQARLREAMDCFRQADTLNPAQSTALSNLLLCMNYDPAIDDARLLAEHKHWGDRFGAVRPLPPASVNRDPDRPLRIGYVSCDFRNHACAYFLDAIFSHHDRQRYPFYAYSGVIQPDPLTTKYQNLAAGWRSTLGLSDPALAQQIRADQIDILVDLYGHTAQSRLAAFAYKAAPIQVSYLGYPNTTGLPTIDYRLTDSIADPPGEPSLYTEELYRLDGPFSCYTQMIPAPEVAPSPALASGKVTFASLNNLQRLNRRVLDTWAQILQAAPNSRLLIFRDTLRGKLKDELFRYLTSIGVDPSRLELGNVIPKEGTMAVFHSVDISLDTFPWSGHTTACQSLYMGAPVITLRGSRHVGRMVSSVLHHIGHDEWIAESREDYVAKAAALASDVGKLAEIRSGLRKAMLSSPMGDGPAFVHGLEAAYRQMWHRWLRK